MGGGKSEVSAAGKGRVRGGMGMWQGGLSSMRYTEKSKMSTNKKGKTSRKEAQGKREGGNQGVMRGGGEGRRGAMAGADVCTMQWSTSTRDTT